MCSQPEVKRKEKKGLHLPALIGDKPIIILSAAQMQANQPAVLQVALMLSRLYKLSCNEALRLTQEFHDARKYPQNVRSPQTAIQRTQVRLPGDPQEQKTIVIPPRCWEATMTGGL